MTAKQISVFLENKPGQLAAFTEVLNDANIDMRAFSIADAQDFGIVRMIVNDSYQTACVLKEAGYILSVTPVLAVEIPDVPGGLNNVLQILGKNKIDIEYTYAFTARKKGTAYMIFRVVDNEKAVEILGKEGIKLISQDQLIEL